MDSDARKMSKKQKKALQNVRAPKFVGPVMPNSLNTPKFDRFWDGL